MARNIVRRLQHIRYQIQRQYRGTFSDAQLVRMAQRLYDAAITPSIATEIAEISLPETVFGEVQLTWTNNNTTVSIVRGDAAVIDDLVDTTVPDVLDKDRLLEVNSELFLANDEYLLVA